MLKTSNFVLIAIIFLSVTVSSLAFAQMESMKITGPTHPLLKSIVTLKISVEGTSRASYGDFSSTLFLIDKETGGQVNAIPVFLLSGDNSVTMNLKNLSTAGKVQAGKYYIARVQHVNIIAEHEFSPVLSEEEIPKATPTEKPPPAVPLVTQETTDLDIYNPGPDGSSVHVISATETGRHNQYLVIFEVCAGTKKVTVPEVTVSSDSESYTREVGTVLSPKSCYLVDTNAEAKDPTTINVTFGNVVKDDTQIEQLKSEIAQLKEEIKKKDAVLMEQLKVISNLAAMMQKTIFEPIFNYFSIV